MYCREEVGFIQTTCHRMGRWKTGKQGREPGTVQAAEVLAIRGSLDTPLGSLGREPGGPQWEGQSPVLQS